MPRDCVILGFQPPLRGEVIGAGDHPGVETPGYYQASSGRVSLATDDWPLTTGH